MDCCYLEQSGSSPAAEMLPLPAVSSPEMFDSDTENKDRNFQPQVPTAQETTTLASSPEKLSPEELIAKSDNYLLARIHKFLSGVPPPPKHTICRSDCSEFLMRIYENRRFFWTESSSTDLKQLENQENPATEPLERAREPSNSRKTFYQRTRSTSRNLSHAFDECDPLHAKSLSSSSVANDGVFNERGDNNREDLVSDRSFPENLREKLRQEASQSANSANSSESEALRYCTVSEKDVHLLTWPEAYKNKFHGIHYNRNKAIEEFENLTMKLCERYVGAETQSTCSVWFTKQGPGSARKKALLAKRDSGQSPGKRLSHLTRRRRTFSSANLQGLGIGDKKQVVLSVRKPFARKGKSPRGKSPRGKSPRGSTKKKVARRLTLDLSPLKSKLETSKRALFQSPTSDRAGPSKLLTTGSVPNAQHIKRALFPTPKKSEDATQSERSKRGTVNSNVEETRKRKNEEELEGPRLKWAKSLSFDCTSELHSNTIVSWDSERHSSSNLMERGRTAFAQGKSELSDTHRKKLLWAVAEALRSKGIGMNHPQFKQYASNLARTIKKFMPDLENRNIPRKPGSTSDRMLKLAKHHVLFIVEARPAD